MVAKCLMFLLFFLACSPGARLPKCKEPYNRVYLSELSLKTHADFDRLDDMVGEGDAVWKIYDMVLKVAPDNTLARVRAAWALFYLGKDEKSRATAKSLLTDLKKSHPRDKDVRFLDLVFATEEFLATGAGNGHDLKIKIDGFVKAFPNYTGPHGLSGSKLLDLIKGKAK